MPREWKINPKFLCDEHLKGEHYELHVFVGLLKLKRQVTGYVEHNMLELSTLKERHDELVEELKHRFPGFKHNSSLIVPDLSYLPENIRNRKIDIKQNELFLFKKCLMCWTHYQNSNKS